jgi:hypothetical protein
LGSARPPCSVNHSSKAFSKGSASFWRRARRLSADNSAATCSILSSCRMQANAACAGTGAEVRDSKNFLRT